MVPVNNRSISEEVFKVLNGSERETWGRGRGREREHSGKVKWYTGHLKRWEAVNLHGTFEPLFYFTKVKTADVQEEVSCFSIVERGWERSVFTWLETAVRSLQWRGRVYKNGLFPSPLHLALFSHTPVQAAVVHEFIVQLYQCIVQLNILSVDDVFRSQCEWPRGECTWIKEGTRHTVLMRMMMMMMMTV